jgi:polyhydroxyalkanoate synthase
MGEQVGSVIDEPKGDRRFKDDAWRENEVFDFIRQSYLLSARFFQNVVRRGGLDPKTAQKVDFYTRQFVDAMSPVQLPAHQPGGAAQTAETGGENLLKGLSHLLADLERGKGQLRIRMTDDSKFKVGREHRRHAGQGGLPERPDAADPVQPDHRDGAEAAAGDLPALDQQVLHPRPAPAEQLRPLGGGAGPHGLRRLLGEPGRALAEKGFEDYMREGVYDALDAIEKATGEREVNAIGYCLGGTLLASTLAHMAAERDTRDQSATFFVTMIDFEEAGELGVFIDEEQLQRSRRR